MERPTSSGSRINIQEELTKSQTELNIYVESFNFLPSHSPSEGNLMSAYMRTSAQFFSLLGEDFLCTFSNLHKYLSDTYHADVEVTTQCATMQCLISIGRKKAIAFQCAYSSGSLLQDIQELLITEKVLSALNVNQLVLGLSIANVT